MDPAQRAQFLRNMLRQVAPELTEQTLAEATSSLESTGLDAAELRGCVEAIHADGPIAPHIAGSLEAIILPQYRPALFILQDDYDRPASPWELLDASENRDRIQHAIPGVGCLALSGTGPEAYVGTAFLVGPQLVMTNRHVAERFATGLGERGLHFKPNLAPTIDFQREEIPTPPEYFSIDQVVMIHPYWDMALLHCRDPLPKRPQLTLSIEDPKTLVDREIVVIGYPAADADRNSLELQQNIFGTRLGCKRLQPGILRSRQPIRHYGSDISALTHDASTLGGNSGSAVLDVWSGHVVGLHFGGKYLQTNYAVPAYELARDSRVVQAGVQFAGKLPATTDYAAVWRRADTITSLESPPVPSHATDPGNPSIVPTPAIVTPTVPITVSITLGTPRLIPKP